MSSQLIRPLEKFQKQEEVSQELQITMRWALKLDLLTVQKAKFKNEKKLFIQLLFMKSMS